MALTIIFVFICGRCDKGCPELTLDLLSEMFVTELPAVENRDYRGAYLAAVAAVALVVEVGVLDNTAQAEAGWGSSVGLRHVEK